MKIKCDYCDSMIDETEKQCPHCGAPLSGVNRTSSSQPQTIEELQQWYRARNLPPEEVTRFFIGKDVREPKAFGIYKKSNGDCVVYKNKSDGTRAVRYEGADESYAVNELYQRLRSQIEDQVRRNNSNRNSGNHGGSGSGSGIGKGARGCLSFIFEHKVASVILFILILSIIAAIFGDDIPSGYYNYNGRDYYRQDSVWYSYDNSVSGWTPEESTAGIYSYINRDNYSNYSNSSFFGNTLFEDTDYYDDYSYSSDSSSNSSSSSSSWFDSDDDDDWDSDWSWDSSDSWDYDWGGSDWDSDW